MDRVLEHAAGDLVARVQAGGGMRQLAEVLAAAGQRLALDPAPGDGPGGGPAGGEPASTGTVGGMLATGAAGPLRLRYGTPRDLLIGITVVRADGTVATSGGKVVKNVAGYDLGKLFAGSYGTLGLIVEAVFRLHPLPGGRPRTSPWTCADAAPRRAEMVAAAAASQLAPSGSGDRPARPRDPVRVGSAAGGGPGRGRPSGPSACAGCWAPGRRRRRAHPAGGAAPARRWGQRGQAAGTARWCGSAFWAAALPAVLAAIDGAAAAARAGPGGERLGRRRACSTRRSAPVPTRRGRGVRGQPAGGPGPGASGRGRLAPARTARRAPAPSCCRAPPRCGSWSTCGARSRAGADAGGQGAVRSRAPDGARPVRRRDLKWTSVDPRASCATWSGLRALRVLPAGLPDVPAVGRGDGLAPRPDPPDHPGAGRRRSWHRGGRRPLRPLPGLHGLRDRLPVRGPVRPADRGGPRLGREPAGRAQPPLPPGRSGTGRCGRRSSRCSRTPAAAGAGGPAARRCNERPGPAGWRGAGPRSAWPPSSAPPCGLAPANPPGRRSRRPERPRCPAGCRPGPAPGRGRACSPAACSRSSSPQVNTATARVLAAEGCDVVIPAGAGLLRRAVAARRPGDGGGGVRPAHDRDVRAGRGGRDRGQLGGLRLGDEGVRRPAGRMTPAGPARAAALSAKVRDLSEFLAELYGGPAGRGGPPPAAGQGRLSRRLPPGPCPADPPAAARPAAGHPGPGAGRDRRRRDMLRFGGRVQPAAAGGRARAGRAESGCGPGHRGRPARFGQPRLRLQIAAALAATDGTAPAVAHTAEVLDASIRGLPATALTGG